MVTVGSILRGTFEFIRSNIPAILVWTVLLLAGALLMPLMMLPIYKAQLASVQAGATMPPSLGAGFWLIIPLMTILFLTIWAAGFRAVLRPADSRFFYLRLGMDELRLFGLILLLMLAMLVLEIVGVIAVIVVGGVLSLVLSKGAEIVLGIVSGLAFLCAFLWLMVRISPAGPLTVLERKISIRPAWRLSRGHFWPLFGAYLIIALGVIALYLAVLFAQMGSVLPDMARPTDAAAVQRVAEWQLAHAQWGGSMIVYVLATTLIYGVSMAVQIGMTAIATRELLAIGRDTEAPSGPWSN